MADSIQGDLSGNIFVEYDYNNIVLVDPNKTVDSRGIVSERLLDHENLVFYANLEAQVLPRTKLALGTQPNENVSTVMTIAGINFLRPQKGNYMTSGYLDELTGKDSLTGRGQNQMQEQTKYDSTNQPYFIRSTVGNNSTFDNGLLGITSINIRTSTSFIPSVSMQLEDVQGRALFQLGDQSPYAAFFNLPYPQFYLTLKGYYGQAIKYQLNLEKFDARFNSSTGNYTVSLEFRGFKFNILNEILISHLIATPHMYNRRYTVTTNPVVANSTTNDRNAINAASGAAAGKSNTSVDAPVRQVTEYVSERGYEKIVEVYNEYKTKGLIPPDFPELTLMQFVYKMDMFEQNVINSYPKANVEPLTNIKNYQKNVQGYFENIRGATPNSWSNTYLDPRTIVLNNGQLVYFFKLSVRQNPVAQQQALGRLKEISTKYIQLLNDNPTLGLKRKEEIKLDNIGYDNFFIKPLTRDMINEARTIERFNNQLVVTDPVISGQTLADIDRLLAESVSQGVQKDYFFVFDAQNRFDDLIRKIDSEAAKKLAIIQQAITDDLARFIQDNTTGIGFKPTVRNIVAVIMANAEAFIRLMDECHTNAWSVRNEKVRKLVIQDTQKSAVNTEAINVIKISTQAANQNQGIVTAEEPVYPWPQFFTESPDDKKGRYQLTYLGDPSVAGLTQAYNNKIWPEVEFVEEYIKGLAQKDNPPATQPALDSQQTTFLTSINAIQYPQNNLTYFNKQIIRFFYEMWERQYVTSYYSNYVRAGNNPRNQLVNLNTKSESQNIIQSLGTSNPLLCFTIKDKGFNAQTYRQTLREFSNNGTGPLWVQYERGEFNTPYIREQIDNPFAIYKTTELGLQPETEIPIESLEQLVKEANNEPKIIDTYPFTNSEWVSDNMSQSNRSQGTQVYNTNQSLKVFTPRNVISNFTNLYEYITNRPVTNFCYLDVVIPNLIQVIPSSENQELNTFYSFDRKPKSFIPTMGYISNPNARNLPNLQTTSILNSPYFINAISKGVQAEKRNVQYPYVAAAYLFLNSLPLASLRERYKTYGVDTELDYIASCFNKFGALHKLPYAWILKIGAIWHRYKTFVDTGNDILDNTVWTNFDYVQNYDPQTSSKTKIYKFRRPVDEVDTEIVLEQRTNNTIKINTGFYPKLINDFAYFYNTKDLFKFYTDQEIQSACNSGLQIFNFPNSNIQGVSSGVTSTVNTWSILLPNGLNDAYTNPNNCIPSSQQTDEQQETKKKYFVIPSFGIDLNQTKSQTYLTPNANVSPQQLFEPVSGNTSMFNGSVRALWGAPNYGYFDSSVIRKPEYDEYMTTIFPQGGDLSPLYLHSTNSYSKIDEIFGVFDRRALNIMEAEFLQFCIPANAVKYQKTNSEIRASLIELDTSLRNFQLFMRNVMTVQTPDNPQKNKNRFLTAVQNQFQGFKTYTKNLMEYDVLVKNGNPSKYNRRIFGSFANLPGLRNPIVYKPYVVNSLPTSGGTTTLAQSQLTYPNEWETLRTEVGFSTIPNLVYSNNGSYITDFFVDNNIEFTVNNITALSQLIKIYATQKLSNPSITSTQFRTSLLQFLGNENDLMNDFLNQVITVIKKDLPSTSQPQDQNVSTQLSGTQGKSELYSLFRAINDKWISGTDYSNKTLFEDFLFLDRASRNIGETIIIDIFGVKNLINSNALNEQMSVYTLVSGLLMNNNFTVMPLPAYVNFYNVLNVDGGTTPNTENIQNFGNNLWGTFTSVDYRNATPKMVCFYVGKPSEQLPLPRQVSGYGDDGFDLRLPNNPLIENQLDKKDWNYSNKVVGFNVDIGIRNQNVFQNFSVSQDTGKATSETIAALLTMIDQKNTRNITTQNASLYNLYKRRSYQCDVSCLGNALIRPTMYFNLRHVPMFYGPYMITEVNHVITPGDFTTNFKGVRQGFFDFPPIDNYIQKINQNLLTKIEAVLFEQTNQNSTLATTQQKKATDITANTPNIEAASEQACLSNLNPQFQTYITQSYSATTVTQLEFSNAIKNKFPNNAQLQTTIYILSYVRTYSTPGVEGGNFMGMNYNFADISLDKPLPPAVENFERIGGSGVYSCQRVKRSDGSTADLPVARFTSLQKYLDFMGAILQERVSQIVQGQMIQYYCTAFPSSQVDTQYYQNNVIQFETRFKKIFEQALESANKMRFVTDFRLTPSQASGIPNNQNTTIPNPPACPPTTITSYSPLTGRTGTIISLSGTNLEYVREIEVGPNRVDLRTIQFINSNLIKFSIPTIVPNVPGQLTIRLRTSGSSQPVVATPNFTFRV